MTIDKNYELRTTRVSASPRLFVPLGFPNRSRILQALHFFWGCLFCYSPLKECSLSSSPPEPGIMESVYSEYKPLFLDSGMSSYATHERRHRCFCGLCRATTGALLIGGFEITLAFYFLASAIIIRERYGDNDRYGSVLANIYFVFSGCLLVVVTFLLLGKTRVLGAFPTCQDTRAPFRRLHQAKDPPSRTPAQRRHLHLGHQHHLHPHPPGSYHLRHRLTVDQRRSKRQSTESTCLRRLDHGYRLYGLLTPLGRHLRRLADLVLRRRLISLQVHQPWEPRWRVQSHSYVGG